MKEEIVQWTLLKKPDYLQSKLGIKFKKKILEEYTTNYGVIDFALETKKEILVVELETSIDNMSKLDYCINQIQRYMNIEFKTDKKIQFVILFDEIDTPKKFISVLEDFAKKSGVLLKTYSILDVQELYKKCLDELKRTAGEYFGSPVAMDVVYLRWLNKVIKPFYEKQIDILSLTEFRKIFNSRTSFGVYTNLARYFKLIGVDKSNVKLTNYGKQFKENYNAQIIPSSLSMPNLSLGQKRVLLDSLTNGNFTKSKVNIYYFLRFIHLTNGSWIPKSTTPEDKEKLKFINFLFEKDYRWTTVRELLLFTCNQCEELGLVERMRITNSDYDKAVLTTLGSRVLGYLELYLHLKREKIQIPLQIEG